MTRHLFTANLDLTPFTPAPDFIADPRQWLDNWLGQHPALVMQGLLAHADDGVIWGKVEHRVVTLSSQLYYPNISPAFQAQTLQQLRLFGPQAELYLWRTAELTFQARLLQDQDLTSLLNQSGLSPTSYFDEAQILWGDRPDESYAPQNGFMPVAEGQGLRHTPPVTVPAAAFDPENNRRPLRLYVRHYLTTDEIGQTRINLSRLVKVDCIEGETNAR
ncbi:MAG TPA: CRISPR-associated protein Csx19 [Anaerolineae bacterium]|nr:CRISPR-associated protein Csx19 [Anaerolineae bacterium]